MMKSNPLRMNAHLLCDFTEYKRLESLAEQFALIGRDC
jgi:hypothetical protein